MKQPKGYCIKGKEDKVYRLHKALYRLKQAPRAWNNMIDSYFLRYGFLKSPNEPSLYVKKEENGDVLVVCLYVDYLIYMGTNGAMIENFKKAMMEEFEMTNLGL